MNIYDIRIKERNNKQTKTKERKEERKKERKKENYAN